LAPHCLRRRQGDGPLPETVNRANFIETIIAAQGQLERKQNRRQVLQKMKARLESGYYVFSQPVGYKYWKDPVEGQVLVRDEPMASILQEALEGYASGRFQIPVEVVRFLESQPCFQNKKEGVRRLLRRCLKAFGTTSFHPRKPALVRIRPNSKRSRKRSSKSARQSLSSRRRASGCIELPLAAQQAQQA
jgi:hypothetical protein